MKKKIAIVSACIVFALALISFSALKIYQYYDAPKTDVLGVQDDSVYFKMTPSQLMKIKGEPLEIIDYMYLTDSKSYVFEENIYGKQATSYYEFQKSILGFRLFQFKARIPVDSEAEGEDLFNKIYEYMTEIYSTKKSLFDSNYYNYYNDKFLGELETDKDMAASFGTRGGAAGINVEIGLDIDEKLLYVDVFRLE